MARTRKATQILNLQKYDVLIDDRGPRSDYFKITQFDGYFHGGRNAFLIAGTTTLKSNSKLLVEILNFNGDTVYSAPVANFVEGSSRLIQVEIYSDTPIGPGKIIVLGSTETYLDGSPIPSVWRDKYNVRWITDVIISPSINNKSQIRFINTPTLVVEEKFYPSSATASFSQSVFVPLVSAELSPIKYNIFQNGYLIKLQEDVFTSDFFGGALVVSASIVGSTNIIQSELPLTRIINDTTAETRGATLLNLDSTVVTNAFISTSNAYSADWSPAGTITIQSSSVGIRYNTVIESSDTGSSSSFTKLRLVNLNTISGEVNKVRVSYKVTTDPGDYTILGDVPTQIEQLLVVDTGSKIVSLGQFQDLNIDDYWYAATMSVSKTPIDQTLPIYYVSSSVYTDLPIIQSSNILIDSIHVTPPISEQSYTDNVSYFVGTRNNVQLRLFPNSEYSLKLTAAYTNYSQSINLAQSDYSVEVYLTSTEESLGTLIERNPRGQLIGTLTPNSGASRQLFENLELNFRPQINQSGTFGLRFIVYGGFWNFSNITLNAAEERFFSPDEVSVLLPNTTYVNKLLTFKTEYLDINNNSTTTVTFSEPTYFTGSRQIINDSFSGSFTGSLLGTASYASNFVDAGAISTIFYVSPDGNDSNSGKTLDLAFRTIKRACNAASTLRAANPGFPPFRVSIQVKTGYYTEEAPVTVPAFTSILGDDLRTVIVKPTPETRTENLFLMNNATYTWGLRFEGCELDDLEDPRNGFFIAFAPSASISTSPYVQNCSATFADPQKFYTPLDQVNGNPLIGNGPGGMIVDDSVLDGYSPLKSMIVDAYTQVAFNGIGICIRGAGYAQLVSFFTNFSRVGVYAIDGGHASLLNSNTTFGDYGLRSIGKRMLIIPDISGISSYASAEESVKITAAKTDIQDFMISQLQIYGNYASAYLDVDSPAYKSTIKDSGLLIDALAADLLVPSASRSSNFIQGLFKGQDRTPGKIHTINSASGFDKGAIAVFRVNDGNQMAHDFTASFHYINEYIQNETNIPTLNASAKLKVSQSLELAKAVIKSVVVDIEPTYLQEFGSLVTSTSHDFSYAGAGVNFLALPPNQLGIGQTNLDIRVVEEDGGRVYHTSGDETGDFYTGQDFVIRQETGVIEGRTFQRALAAQFTPLALSLESL
jgi:hypothetical protein